jgi:hypothetical protein
MTTIPILNISTEEADKIIQLNNDLEIRMQAKEFDKIDATKKIRYLLHEFVHILDFSRFKKFVGSKKDLSDIKDTKTAGTKEYYKRHLEQSVSIQNIINDLMTSKADRTWFGKMKDSQEFLKRFAERHHPNISKSGINTKENLKNWNRFVSEFMSKVRDANHKIKIKHRDENKPIKPGDLIPENFGFLTRLKE